MGGKGRRRGGGHEEAEGKLWEGGSKVGFATHQHYHYLETGVLGNGKQITVSNTELKQSDRQSMRKKSRERADGGKLLLLLLLQQQHQVRYGKQGQARACVDWYCTIFDRAEYSTAEQARAFSLSLSLLHSTQARQAWLCSVGRSASHPLEMYSCTP